LKGALVIGGGIAGIQASLDLANSGIKVYLVERSPSLGGRMAQLDKTFPTNDCAMCILSPKLVEVARHPNIEMHTLSEVTKVEGEKGDFKVNILRHPRYVDESKCVGCGECAKECPVTVPNEFDMELSERKAAYIPFPQAVPLKYTLQKRGKSPCKIACPTKTNVQGYVALIREGKFREALELVKKAHPFPGICGRVCTHPCEQNCKRGDVDDPLAISALKRFIADLELKYDDAPILPKPKEAKPKKVAIVGGGPAGLTAAYNLTLEGYQTTVFEALPVLGGMMWVGIPSYRLPREVIQREIDAILSLGVDVKLSSPIGEDVKLEDLQKDYDAIFIAAGAHKPFKLEIPGEDAQGVHHGVTFMRNVNLNTPEPIGERVAVIGGGNTAMDCARSARRLGAREVYVLYRRSRNEMPVDSKEVEEAEEEGVKFHFLASPTQILSDEKKKVSGIQCIKMELGEPDESGRRRPIPIADSEFTILVDCVIPAVSQSPDISFLPKEAQFEMTRWDRLAANSETLMTSTPGIFAGGDFVTGPSSVIQAIAAGERAAIAIDKYLSGVEDLEGEMKEEELPDISDMVDITEVAKENRMKPQRVSVEERLSGFGEVEIGLTEEEAVAEARRCLSCGICSECLECVKACEAEAIVHDMVPEEIELDVGAIVVATGFDLIDPTVRSEYGYGIYNNVLTSLQFERLLSASGPTSGRILRPSDSAPPSTISFVQCYGSRDLHRGCRYCSRVCCMYTMKEAMLAKEHESSIENLNIFYMDIRAYGKGFESYYSRAKNDINFYRTRPSNISEDSETKDILVRIEDTQTGKTDTLRTNLLVLSSAIVPSKGTEALAEILGIDMDENGFFKGMGDGGVVTTRDGVYICGATEAPKDIPDTVSQASGAAVKAMQNLYLERVFEEEVEAPTLDEAVISGEPRVGVFVCHCGSNIAGVIDIDDVVDYVKTLPNVVYASNNTYTCSDDSQKKIQDAIAEEKLNRIIVAACSPRTHEPIFRDTCQKAGLNPYLFEMANIRNQCSWVHSDDKEKATLKAKDLIRMAVARARFLEPMEKSESEVGKEALVIGGGIAGISSALDLSSQGFNVHVVEKTPFIGGRVADRTTLSPWDIEPSELLDDKYITMDADPNISTYLNTGIKEISGFIGNFDVSLISKSTGVNGNCNSCGDCEKECPVTVDMEHDPAFFPRKAIYTKKNSYPRRYAIDFQNCNDCGKCVEVCKQNAIDLKQGPKDVEINTSTIIIAIGSDPYKPMEDEFGYQPTMTAAEKDVITNVELEHLLSEDELVIAGKKPKTVAFIHCVGSRNEDFGCSRYCCQITMKQTLDLRKKGVEVLSFYRDIRAFGKGVEELYQKARNSGVMFFRYEPENMPTVVREEDGLKVRFYDKLFGETLLLDVDCVVLSVGMRPGVDTKVLQLMLKTPLSSEGYFLEKHPKLGPLETNTEGIYICGCAQYPKSIVDTMAQASGAASKAAIPMGRGKAMTEGIPSVVNEEACRGCGDCAEACEFNAITLEQKEEGRIVSRINELLCKGCGACATVCCNGAIKPGNFTDRQIFLQIEALGVGE
jgi:heterodisulfide reductase subunit A-like polyferredoxin